jgi:transposase-like protein
VGEQTFDAPQARVGGFYPSLDKGMGAERALDVVLAEMYVQGVSTRKVITVLQALLGPDVAISSTQHRASAAGDRRSSTQVVPFQNIPL